MGNFSELADNGVLGCSPVVGADGRKWGYSGTLSGPALCTPGSPFAKLADGQRPIRDSAQMNRMHASHQSALVNLIIARLGVYQYDRLATCHTAEIDLHRVHIFREEDKVLLIVGSQAIPGSSTDATVIWRHAQFQSTVVPKLPVRLERSLERSGMIATWTIRMEGSVSVEPFGEVAKEAAHSPCHGLPPNQPAATGFV